MLTPAIVFWRAVGGTGAGEAGVPRSGAVAGTKSCSSPARPSSSCLERAGEGVRRGVHMETRGGVGEASKPGGLDGDKVTRGLSMTTGAQRSMRSGQAELEITGEEATRFERGMARNTEVGDRGGEDGGVRFPCECLLAAPGKLCCTGLRPRASGNGEGTLACSAACVGVGWEENVW